jgi:hypothetical protein
MVLGLPSISEWLSQQNQKVQAQFEVIFMLAPFMAGWMVFLYHWVFELKSEMDSLPLPSVIMSVGYMFYFRWKNKILEEASSLDAINMKIRWWEGYEQSLSNVIAGWMDLSDKDAYGDGAPLLNVPRRCAQCDHPVNPGEKAPELCPVCKTPIPSLGVFLLGGEKLLYSKVRFENRSIDYEGRLWRWAVFLHYYPKDLTFKKIPGQWFTHKGLMFRTSTASIDVTYLGFKEEIHHVKFFLVTSSPERTRRIQMGIGLTPSSADPEDLKKAKDLSSLRLGIEEYAKRLEAEAHADLSFESQIDAKTRGYKGSERVLEDLDGIRSQRGLGGLRANWKKYVIYVLVLVALVWFAWSSGWFGGGAPPPTPGLYPNGTVIPDGSVIPG